ncbi:MAG: hypothetical protein KF703_16555 [Actinobacteria bacterium]|nr:hypothetical protein [Actinomycetota bacterium]
MTHHLSHPRRTVAAIVAAVLVAVPLAACASSGSESFNPDTTQAQAAYCAAWDDVVDAFKAFDDLDLVNDGISSVQTFLDDLGTSLQAFADAADTKLRPQVDDLKAAIDALGKAIAGDAGTDLGDAATQLRTAWDALVAALREDCPTSTGGS